MKKITALIFVLIMLTLSVGLGRTEAAENSFNGKAVKIGDTVRYSYWLKTPMKVVNTDFTINYTGETLELIKEDDRTRFPVVYSGSMFNSDLENRIKATCSNIGAMYDFTNGGILFTVSFKVKGAGKSEADASIDFINGVNPKGIAYSEVSLVKRNKVVYDGVSVSENSEVLSSCDHNFMQSVEPSSCTRAGRIVKTCSVCGYSETQVIPALGHSWGEWVVVRQPTEKSQGEEKRTCSVDGAVETRTIPKLGVVFGDLDGDRKLTENDSLIVQKYCARMISADRCPTQKADINSDGEVTIKDATVIQKKAAGTIQ